MAPAYFFVFFLLSHLVLLHSAEVEKCLPFYCGKPDEIPFDGLRECGWVTVGNCTESVPILPKIQLDQGGGKWFDVLGISQADTIAINDTLFLEHLQNCHCKSSENWILPSSLPISINFTTDKALSKCYPALNTTSHTYFSYVGCHFCDYNHDYQPHRCSSIHPQINMNYTNNDNLLSLLAADIFLVVQVSDDCHKCYYKGDECKSDDNGKVQCANTGNKNLGLKLGLSLGIIVPSAGIGVLMFIVCCFWRKSSSNKSMAFWKKETQSHQNVEVFLRNYGSLFPKRYSYSNVKKMTNSFKDKLGQGGFGGVYKGKLHDGRLVAVKVLNKSKGDGQDFVNEVASISRTSHVNIVTLLGFCFEGSKRALIYEFVPNGSLEEFIYEKNTLKVNRQLGWETLYQIAIGIAQGLEYLHRGCNTRILHFDIKPHNILLDQDFSPKISDFGLAKLCPNRESIISMLGARGTAGYIAPEVFCRNFGGVSHKSDVYSYGMMVLEMVGGRKNIDVGVDHTSEIYFPHWIYKRLEQADELGLHGVMNEDENEKARKMILVGLWCIQTDPSNRPPIGRVVDMLQGSLGSLQIPPCPFLSSPPRSPADSLTSPIMTS